MTRFVLPLLVILVIGMLFPACEPEHGQHISGTADMPVKEECIIYCSYDSTLIFWNQEDNALISIEPSMNPNTYTNNFSFGKRFLNEDDCLENRRNISKGISRDSLSFYLTHSWGEVLFSY